MSANVVRCHLDDAEGTRKRAGTGVVDGEETATAQYPTKLALAIGWCRFVVGR